MRIHRSVRAEEPADDGAGRGTGQGAGACRRRSARGSARQDHPAGGRSPPSRSGSPSRSSRRRCGSPLVDRRRHHGRALRHLPPAVAHPDQVPRPGHDLPDRLPGHPGRLHGHAPRSPTSATATAAPRKRRSPRSRRGSVQQVAGSTEYVLTIAAERRPGHRRPRLPARRPGHEDRPAAATPRASTPLPDAVAQRARQGHRGAAGPGPAERRRGRRPIRRARDVLRPDGERGDQDPGPEPRLRGPPDARPTTRPATASPTPRPARSGPPTTIVGLVRRRRRQDAAPGLAGQRRPGQLHPGVHRPGRVRPVPGHPRLELRVRHPVGAHHVRRRAARGDGPQLARSCGRCASTGCSSSCPTRCRRSRCSWSGATCSTRTSG